MTDHTTYVSSAPSHAVRALVLLAALAAAAPVAAKDPVFFATLQTKPPPASAGRPLTIDLAITVDDGWHINTLTPQLSLLVPTTLVWTVPEGWPLPHVSVPAGKPVWLAFADRTVDVWQERVVLKATLAVPASASGTAEITVAVTAQACDDNSCLPPVTSTARIAVDVAQAGAATTDLPPAPDATTGSQLLAGTVPSTTSALASRSLPLLLLTVFLAGLALNLTPCVYPLIPITIGFFSQQARGGRGSSFALALAYVLGMSVTYSALGVTAALTGQLFGAAMQSPTVIVAIVVVMLALASSMFGLWEMRVPGWAQRASGGRSGVVGAALMGLIIGFVAAPCIGPFVLGLLTFVGQRGEPLFGLLLFFTLAMGLGFPYLLLGTFTGAADRLPNSGMWMVGVRRVFGVVLVAMAAYFARPLLPAPFAPWLLGSVLVLGALYLLIIERTGHEQPAIDRVVRLACVILVVAGLAQTPLVARNHHSRTLTWLEFDRATAAAAVASGRPVILDFTAAWCAACHELDEKTFSDAAVADVLDSYARFRIDQTSYDDAARELAASYDVRGLPTVIVFKKGREAFRITGFEPPERFLGRLNGGIT